jgi:hypothetical protein
MSAFIQEINNDEDGNPTKCRSHHRSTKRKRKVNTNNCSPENGDDTGFSGSESAENDTDSSNGSDPVEIPNDEVRGMTHFRVTYTDGFGIEMILL